MVANLKSNESNEALREYWNA